MTESRSLPPRDGKRVATGVVALLLTGLIAGVLTGCGASHVAANGTVKIGLRDYRITPSSVDAAGGSLTLVIRNYGRLTHDLVIQSASGTNDAVSDPVGPGQSTTLLADLAPGTYEMFSNLSDDKELGLYGTLKVS